MDARETLCEARDASQALESHELRSEAKYALCVMRGRSDGPTGRGGVSDPTRRIDDLVDFDEGWERERERLNAVVSRAARMLDAYERLDPAGSMVLTLRFLRSMRWSAIASLLDEDEAEVRRRADVAIDRIDSEGLNVYSGEAKVTAAAPAGDVE